MENTTATNSNSAPQNTDLKNAVLKEICAKWSKFSEQDVAAMKGKADLVSQVVTKRRRSSSCGLDGLRMPCRRRVSIGS